MNRRNVETFSLSFLDIITCGLGAVILLFVLINAKSAARQQELTSNLRAQADQLEIEVAEGRKYLVEARNSLENTQSELVKTEGLSREVLQVLRLKQKELADRLKDSSATRQDVRKLMTDLQNLEEELARLRAIAAQEDQDGSKLRPFPGQGDRQYLTGLKMGGRRILILVDASASMLDETIVGVIRRRNLDPAAKLQSAKWRRVVLTVEWLTAQLPRTSQYQVYAFNETARPLVEEAGGSWMAAAEAATLNSVVAQMRRLVPQKGTSLLNAFEVVGRLQPRPDNVFLLTDSLPTMGKDKPWGKRVSGKKRLSLFNAAVAGLPSQIPVNIILFPMEGDPLAADAFWRLAKQSRGSFFSPSRDWP
jgi:hypothetical protein